VNISTNIVNSTALLPDNSATHQKRDIASQTVLTFPPTLPKEIEDLLKNFRYNDNQENRNFEETLDTTNQSDRSMMDISVLRRKLFISHESPVVQESFGSHLNLDFSPPPRTPELTTSCVNSGTLRCSDSFNSDMFGELSPIRACSSPAFTNDISMISDCAQEKTPKTKGKALKKKKGKNLSQSFCQIEQFPDDKESLIENPLLPESQPHFDSGFSDEKSVSHKLSELMQF